MALIKCKSCGHVMSDRAEFCPHCGCPKEFCVNEDTSMAEDTPVSEETCATTTKTVSMPENLNSNANDNDNEATTTQDIEEDDNEENSANRGLLGIVGILTIIALVFAGFLYSGNRYYNGKTLKFTIDTCAVDTDSYVDDSCSMDSCGELTPYELNATDSAASSNDYIDNEQIEEEEIGFKSNTDVMDFVLGNSYSYNGITLRITDEAVYANDNKISTSKPVFRKISLNKGIITARPSISITVVRDENRLVDNNNGDTYY